MARLTYQTPDGNWGVRGIDIKQMPAAVYGAWENAERKAENVRTCTNFTKRS